MNFNHVEVKIENTGEFYKHHMSTTTGWKEEIGVKVLLNIGSVHLEFFVGMKGNDKEGFRLGFSGALSGCLCEISEPFPIEKLDDELEDFIDHAVIQHLINSDMDLDRAIAVEEYHLKKFEKQWGKKPETIKMDGPKRGSWMQ